MVNEKIVFLFSFFFAFNFNIELIIRNCKDGRVVPSNVIVDDGPLSSQSPGQRRVSVSVKYGCQLATPANNVSHVAL